MALLRNMTWGILCVFATRVPGLPIRDCAGSCNSSVQMCTSVNAFLQKAILERLYSVPGRGTFWLSVNCPCASTPPPTPLTLWLILDFPALLFKFFTLVALHFFGQHDSRSNLAESLYPLRHLVGSFTSCPPSISLTSVCGCAKKMCVQKQKSI